ncbi:MAG: 4-hydroxy-tetrahydrodipicolinate reductase [Campylobacteraceae bacterium]|jgi:4-hydroxy-tetrahydrodipicolinate reductase|nr:4-hydroxy-tetrahydrodipicolinate reductase [Campylobacteraceae bacterium]
MNKNLSLNVGIYGSTGRVGRVLIENLQNDKEVNISCLYAIDEFKFTVPEDIKKTDSLETLFDLSDVVIDFTAPSGTEALLRYALTKPKPLIVGTTGLNSEQLALLKQAAQSMPILYSTNMSLGIAVLNKLVELASEKLRDFDIEIVEQHHRFKKDAPSGTALTLGEHAAKARELEFSKVRVSGRDGIIGQRDKDEIAVMSLRGGDIVGRHTVGFYNDGEFIELHHTATSRDTFAKGAIHAAKWIVNQPNKQYAISDCLGLQG